MNADDFPLTDFRLLYPKFVGVSDDLLMAVAKQAICFINDCGGACNDQLWMLLVAHMLQLRADDEAGNANGRVASASIDKVSVSYAAPPAGSDSSYWLGLTPWGQQYLVLMKRCGAAPFYVGSLPERSAFRSVGGVFPNRGRVRRW